MTNTDTNPKQPKQPLSERGSNRSRRPDSQAFREFIGTEWARPSAEMPALQDAAPSARAHREDLSKLFPGERLVIPAGQLKARNNDCDFAFRAHSAFVHLTGLGAEAEPDSVLVLHPQANGSHQAVLYFKPRSPRDSEEFYADSRYGELWVGARPSLAEMEATCGINCAAIDDLPADLAKDAGPGRVKLRVVPQADAQISQLVEQARQAAALPAGPDAVEVDERLAEALSELRLVKDAWEIGQISLAIKSTHKAYDAICQALPRALQHPRGERVLEAAFTSVAREEGNGVGYDSIIGCGDHANTLHWIANNGPVTPGSLILIDAGIEIDSLYTADITRTIPVDGVFTPIQRQIYDAVLAALDAAFEVLRQPGVLYREMHNAAMDVIAHHLADWGLLPVSAAESLRPDGQQHRRWMPHGTGHHLGLDVHDCAQSRREMYLDAPIRPGMCFTIEPGLYFRKDDLRVPAEMRGIGVRIEDNIYIRPDGQPENLSHFIPRTADEVEAWVQRLAKS